MIKKIKGALSDSRMKRAVEQAISAAREGDEAGAREALQPLLRALHEQPAVARLLQAVADGHFSVQLAVDVLQAVRDAHAGDDKLLVMLGETLSGARDVDDLNAPAPDHPFFLEVVDALIALEQRSAGLESQVDIVQALAVAARMVARQRDEAAYASSARLVELEPNSSSAHYNFGLLCKTRGRFEEGMVANQRAAELEGETVDSYEWNLGICATGAGNGSLALDVWQRMGDKIEMGRFALPEGRYSQCKVRLAQFPLAERGVDNDSPGLEETIWIQRLSPAHGIIRSVLHQDLGVDYGDVVLIDGAPITYHTYAGTEIPVFPHLATLRRNHYQFFDFAGTQDDAGRLGALSRALEEDAIVYSHTENMRYLCSQCWRNPGIDHEKHHQEQQERVEEHVVVGRIAAPPHMDVGLLVEQLDRAASDDEPCAIYSPSLCEVAGLEQRLPGERRRFEMLRASTSS